MTLVLRPLDVPAAQSVAAGECPQGWRCAADYPSVDDRVAAGMFLQRIEIGIDPRPFGAFALVVGDGSDELVVGGAGFHGGLDPSGRVEIGYSVVASQRGNGHATRALGQLIVLARALGAQTLIADADVENAASRAVLTRCGFASVDGELVDGELVDGELVDGELERFELQLA